MALPRKNEGQAKEELVATDKVILEQEVVEEVVVENNAPEATDQAKQTPIAPEEEAPMVEEEVAIVEAVAKKVKMYKVKFIEKHEFNVGGVLNKCKKGDVLSVELHIANQLSQRKLAYILG